MKKFIRILIIVLVIVGIAVGAYFLFFDIDRNLTVYHNVQEAMKYKYDIDFDEDLYGLSVLGYNDNNEQFSDTNYPTIAMIRNKMFEKDTNSKLVGGTEQSGWFYYYGYAKYEELLVEGIRFYSNYAVLADKASKMYSNQICSKIDGYTASMEIMWDYVKDLKTIQNEFGKEASTIAEETLVAKYEELRNLYRSHLYKAADLLIGLRDFVIQESFDNVYSFDTTTMLFDSVAETIHVAMMSKQDQEINYLHDATVYVDLYYEYLENNAIEYGFVDEVGYLSSYSDLYLNNREDYNKLFQFTHFQKNELIKGDNSISAQIKVGYLDHAKIILSILGI